MKPRSTIFFIALLNLLVTGSTLAQISVSGLTDFEFRFSGEDSSPFINQTPAGGLSLYTPNIRLFLSANLSDQWFVNSVLQADHYKGEELSSPFFSLMNINWSPNFDSEFIATAGRFVLPYGSYSNSFLSNTNPFVHLPMSHSVGLPVNNTFGHLKDDIYNPLAITEVYGENQKLLTMVYQRMYTQGIKVSHTIGENKWLSFDLAATLAPASSHLDFGKHDEFAKVGRVVLQPVIWAKLGVSYSKGTLIVGDAISDSLLVYNLSSYPQILKGADLTFNYRYYTILVEWNQSFWKAPFYDPETSTSDNPRTGKATIDHISTEFVYDFPFLVGGYAALRYEKMLEGEIEIYSRDEGFNKVDQSFNSWTYNRQRFEFVAGYKLQRNILLKASYLFSDDEGPNLDDDVFTIQLSVLF
tara:strand:+ start:60039 stop:61277 length:1239 start_codon:yes stop_codon:yes gene_type:complete